MVFQVLGFFNFFRGWFDHSLIDDDDGQGFFSSGVLHCTVVSALRLRLEREKNPSVFLGLGIRYCHLELWMMIKT